MAPSRKSETPMLNLLQDRLVPQDDQNVQDVELGATNWPYEEPRAASFRQGLETARPTEERRCHKWGITPSATSTLLL